MNEIYNDCDMQCLCSLTMLPFHVIMVAVFNSKMTVDVRSSSVPCQTESAAGAVNAVDGCACRPHLEDCSPMLVTAIVL